MHKSTKEICEPTKRHNYKVYDLKCTKFVVPSHYTVIKNIGRGAYGFVCSAIDDRTSERYAIKKCEKVFRELEDGKRVLRESTLMRFFNHPNLLNMIELLPPCEGKAFEDIYLVTELMDTDLNVVLRSRQQLDDNHYQYFVYQMLRGLKYLHSGNVMHRDLKPSNLLTNISCELKICDFGLAREVSEDDAMTEYVVTRWYRAPELLLMCQHYDISVDIWSVGCIFVEMILRRPLFQGKDYFSQLDLICRYLGKPSASETWFVTEPHTQKYLKHIPSYASQSVEQLVARIPDPNIGSFVSKMLCFNPKERASAAELLAHPYLAHLHDENDEPSKDSSFIFHLEKSVMTEPLLRKSFWDEIKHFHPDHSEIGFSV